MGAMLTATTATTRLDHIRANLEAVRARVGGRLVLAAVKADAYGHGALAVARMRTGSAWPPPTRRSPCGTPASDCPC